MAGLKFRKKFPNHSAVRIRRVSVRRGLGGRMANAFLRSKPKVVGPLASVKPYLPVFATVFRGNPNRVWQTNDGGQRPKTDVSNEVYFPKTLVDRVFDDL